MQIHQKKQKSFIKLIKDYELVKYNERLNRDFRLKAKSLEEEIKELKRKVDEKI